MRANLGKYSAALKAMAPLVGEGVLTRFPLARLVTADDVARRAVFLVSDAATFVTGQTVAVVRGVQGVAGADQALDPTVRQLTPGNQVASFGNSNRSPTATSCRIKNWTMPA